MGVCLSNRCIYCHVYVVELDTIEAAQAKEKILCSSKYSLIKIKIHDFESFLQHKIWKVLSF